MFISIYSLLLSKRKSAIKLQSITIIVVMQSLSKLMTTGRGGGAGQGAFFNFRF